MNDHIDRAELLAFMRRSLASLQDTAVADRNMSGVVTGYALAMDHVLITAPVRQVVEAAE